MSERTTRGWLDLGARISRVVLSNPGVRRDIDTVARHVEPDEAPDLVRALLWTDTGVTGTVIAMLPDVANAGIEAGRELGRQALRLPPGLVHATTDQVLSKIRFHGLGVAAGQAIAVVVRWLAAREPSPDDLWSRAAHGLVEGLRKGGVEPADAVEIPLEVLAARLERAVQKDPHTLRHAALLVRRVMARHPELVRALRTARGEQPEEVAS